MSDYEERVLRVKDELGACLDSINEEIRRVEALLRGFPVRVETKDSVPGLQWDPGAMSTVVSATGSHKSVKGGIRLLVDQEFILLGSGAANRIRVYRSGGLQRLLREVAIVGEELLLQLEGPE